MDVAYSTSATGRHDSHDDMFDGDGDDDDDESDEEVLEPICGGMIDLTVAPSVTSSTSSAASAAPAARGAGGGYSHCSISGQTNPRR